MPFTVPRLQGPNGEQSGHKQDTCFLHSSGIIPNLSPDWGERRRRGAGEGGRRGTGRSLKAAANRENRSVGAPQAEPRTNESRVLGAHPAISELVPSTALLRS